MIKKLALTISSFTIFIAASSPLFAYTSTEIATEKRFEEARNNNQTLEKFLIKMPKGGDLHNHMGGASMAEKMVQYALKDGLCIDKTTYTASIKSGCQSDWQLVNIVNNPTNYDALIDAWSMKHFQAGSESGHDHFFATFSKFGYISANHNAEILAEIADRAGSQNELYLELMNTLDGNASGRLGKQLGWNNDFATMREQLLTNGLPKIVSDMSIKLTADENKQKQLSACGTTTATPGCNVKVNYLYQVLREQAPEQVFAQLLAGFEGAIQDPRIVGINMVQPEDGKISMRDYDLQMKMINYLRTIYPAVRVTLHAGELTSALVPNNGLQFHIRNAVEVASANRIGHGVDIASEKDSEQLLNEMAEKKVMVEINLSSNQAILNVLGKNHPLALYMKHNVPVAISTDDEGVSRSNISNEYLKAVTEQGLDYLTLKKLSRNSLEFSFLPGNSLWVNNDYQITVNECKNDSLNSTKLSPSCEIYLSKNEKAFLEWQLEKKFIAFEKN